MQISLRYCPSQVRVGTKILPNYLFDHPPSLKLFSNKQAHLCNGNLHTLYPTGEFISSQSKPPSPLPQICNTGGVVSNLV